MNSQTNLNPKTDALLVLQVLITNCPDAQFNKELVMGMINKVAAEPNPQNLLHGKDLIDYLQTKGKQRVIHGPANTNNMPGV